MIAASLWTLHASHADGFSPIIDRTPEIHLSVPAQFQGMNLTTFFVNANRAVISTDDRQLDISEIKKIVESGKVSSQVTIPSQSIARSGFRTSYNYVVFAVHSQNRFVWINASGSPVQDPRLKANEVAPTTDTVSKKIQSISTSGIQSTLQRPTTDGPGSINLTLTP